MSKKDVSVGESQVSRESSVLRPVNSIYSEKTDAYFAGSRLDIVDMMPANPRARVLEIGCGAGATGGAVRAAGKAEWYVGLELDPAAAAIAETRLNVVHVGNAEEMDLTVLGSGFDALIMSEVLEHLVDPGALLKRLAPLLSPGAAVYASSPNIANRTVIRALVAGRFEYTEMGVMDRTHLRWFTPHSFAAMFEAAGIRTVSVGPLGGFRGKARLFNQLTGSRFSHLFMTQIMFVGRRDAGIAS